MTEKPHQSRRRVGSNEASLLQVVQTLNLPGHDFRVRCRDCLLSRSYGNAPLTAKCKADSHALRRMHRVDVLDHGEVTYSNVPTTMGDLFDAPPF